MFKILTLNKIDQIGIDQFNKTKYQITDTETTPDAILVRSAAMHDHELPANLKAIARAGAGTNNIPLERCTEKGIVVFNTPGANANAVKELAICALFLASRGIIDGINWAQTLTGDDVAKQVEKGKSNFAGPEIKGKTLGVIGLGAIGALIANAAQKLGMNVIGYDPHITVENAWRLSRNVIKAENINELYENCDYISLNAPLNDATKFMICEEVIAKMKKGVRILNFSRAGLVDDNAIIKATEDGAVACYITDFPTPELINKKNIIPIPHLGASTPESEETCAEMAAQELIEYLETGNITNSVNMPSCTLERTGDQRICVIHDNVPKVVGKITAILAENNINIEGMINKSRGNIAYTVIDIIGTVNGCEERIREISEVKLVRVI
jgi:D-3-phosphoglycerate dehydrogenase